MSCITAKLRLQKCERLEGQGDDDLKFCLECKDLSHCLASIAQHATVSIQQEVASSKVDVHCFDEDAKSRQVRYRLNTYVEDDMVKLSPMNFEMLVEVHSSCSSKCSNRPRRRSDSPFPST